MSGNANGVRQINPYGLYSLEDAARVIGCGVYALKRQIRSGSLRFVRLGRKRLLLGGTLLRWLEGREEAFAGHSPEQRKRIRARLDRQKPKGSTHDDRR
jgi:excisionase family DNA binding protein